MSGGYIKKGNWGKHPNSLAALRMRAFFNQLEGHSKKMRTLQQGLLNAGFRKPSMLLVCAIYAVDKASRMLKNSSGATLP